MHILSYTYYNTANPPHSQGSHANLPLFYVLPLLCSDFDLSLTIHKPASEVYH